MYSRKKVGMKPELVLIKEIVLIVCRHQIQFIQFVTIQHTKKQFNRDEGDTGDNGKIKITPQILG